MIEYRTVKQQTGYVDDRNAADRELERLVNEEEWVIVNVMPGSGGFDRLVLLTRGHHPHAVMSQAEFNRIYDKADPQ